MTRLLQRRLLACGKIGPVGAASEGMARVAMFSREQAPAGPEIGEAQNVGAPTGLWEWFSASRSRVVTTEPNKRPPEDAPDDWVLLTEVEAKDSDEPDDAHPDSQ